MDTPLTARAALLQILVSGSGFGLELAKLVKERTGGIVVLNDGAMYPALKQLEAERLVRSFEQPLEPGRGGRCRRYYELTKRGLERARREREGLMGLFNDSASNVRHEVEKTQRLLDRDVARGMKAKDLKQE